MSSNSEFMESVLADVKKYDGIRRPLKASLFERTVIRKLSVKKLHPNPDDEFSMERIGPNFGIIGKYVKEINHNLRHDIPIFDDPVLVEKMAPNGYMLINGHHRWAACVMRRIPRIHVKVVNVTNLDYIHDALDRTDNNKRITLNFEEIAVAVGETENIEKIGFWAAHGTKERMRLGVPNLIFTLQKKGYDVWVFTSDFYSNEYIEKFFKYYGVRVDGIITGMGNKVTSKIVNDESIKEKVAGKYVLTINADTKSVYYSAKKGEEYDMIDLPEDEGKWSDNVLSIIGTIEEKVLK